MTAAYFQRATIGLEEVRTGSSTLVPVAEDLQRVIDQDGASVLAASAHFNLAALVARSLNLEPSRQVSMRASAM
jgi:hypothetical protein